MRTPTSELTTRGILRRALAIHRNPAEPQDMDILCPVRAGGWWCQWVAGHYGGCVLGRPGQQQGRLSKALAPRDPRYRKEARG